MRVRERFDHSYFGTGLRPDDDLDAACMEVLNSIERTRWIMLRVANKESESDRVILGTDVFEISLLQSAMRRRCSCQARTPIRLTTRARQS